MFSGIVESHVPLLQSKEGIQVVYFYLKRPKDFQDLRCGDSIAVNGVCLTLEAFDEEKMQFALGPETLKITGWAADLKALNQSPSLSFNLERSLRFGDRIHGHLLSGHVDAMGEVAASRSLGEALEISFSAPSEIKHLLWKKGSVGINGVSLTINEVSLEPSVSLGNHSHGELMFSVCLIPETLRRTNLGALKVGDRVALEADSMARALWHWHKEGKTDTSLKSSPQRGSES